MKMASEKKLFDGNALIAYFEEQYSIAMEDPDPVSGYAMAALRTCIDYFKTIPVVDAVEVVRCRDCEHFTDGMAIGMCKRNPDKPILPIPYNHFCSFGKRRNDV